MGLRKTENLDLYVVLLFLALLTAGAGQQLLESARNTLDRHPGLVLGKKVNSGLMGVIEAGQTRNLLHNDQLHMEAWHGCQQILTVSQLGQGSLEMDCKIEDGQNLSVLADWSLEGYRGFRLSRTAGLASSAFSAVDLTGRFRSTQPISASLPDGWFHLRLECLTSGLDLYLNGRLYARLPGRKGGHLGLQSGLRGCSVDNLVLRDEKRTLLDDDFSYHGRRRRILALSFALAFSPLLLPGWRRAGRPVLGRLVVIYLTALSIMVAGYAFERLWLSSRYFCAGYTPWGQRQSPHPVEVARQLLFENDFLNHSDPDRSFWPLKDVPAYPFQPLEARGLAIYDPNLPVRFAEDSQETVQALYEDWKTDSRVLLLGGSQTWGSGALSQDLKVAGYLHSYLKGARLLNAAMWSTNSSQHLSHYKAFLHQLRPQIVIVNWGNNDADAESLTANLTEMARLSRLQKFRLVVVLEANHSEAGEQEKLAAKHRALRAVSQSYGLKLVDAHAELQKPEVLGGGFLWWDIVHMTSYGQQQLAQLVAESLR